MAPRSARPLLAAAALDDAAATLTMRFGELDLVWVRVS